MDIPNKNHWNFYMYFFSKIIFTEIIFNLLIKIFRFQWRINADSDGNSSNFLKLFIHICSISLNVHPIAFKFSGYTGIVNNNALSNTEEMILFLSVTSYSFFNFSWLLYLFSYVIFYWKFIKMFFIKVIFLFFIFFDNQAHYINKNY